MSDDCTDLDDLLARADAALYQAKRDGPQSRLPQR